MGWGWGWFDTRGWVHPPGSPRTGRGRWVRGRRAGLRRRPYEETVGWACGVAGGRGSTRHFEDFVPAHHERIGIPLAGLGRILQRGRGGARGQGWRTPG